MKLSKLFSFIVLSSIGLLIRIPWAHADEFMPRTVIAFYDSRSDPRRITSPINQFLSMPLNHEGLFIEPHDITAPLPDISERHDVIGILVWSRGLALPKPREFIEWANKATDSGRKLVVFGEPGVDVSSDGQETPDALVQAYLAPTGVRFLNEVIFATYKYRLDHVVDDYFSFERPFPVALPRFNHVMKLQNAQSILSVAAKTGSDHADLAVFGPQGAYMDDTFARVDVTEINAGQWYVNPFHFLSKAFGIEAMPKPDVTTLVGRRIYFSQIDGDGWRNGGFVKNDKGQSQRPIETLYEKIFTAYPDLPFTVAPIAADLDPDWCGDDKAQESARQIFALPNIEPASHTYSHPLDWNFFADNNPDKEKPFLSHYPACTQNQSDFSGKVSSFVSKILGNSPDLSGTLDTETEGEGSADDLGYVTPRSYAKKPFDLALEITGARDYIEKFAPPGKHVSLIQWSGNTLAFPAAIDLATASGLANLNGGDTRFDREFNSNSWVAPVGRYTEGGWQIYAASSNENTYTDHWTDRFYGLGFLPQTYSNTETPRRLTPIDLYFHVFVASREAGIDGLKTALDYISQQEIVPLRASDYARVAAGFYTTHIAPLSETMWRIENRGHLQTIRFDDVSTKHLDLATSKGVLGERVINGSLYIALDPDSEMPIIALTDHTTTSWSLIESRWPIHGLVHNDHGIAFKTSGYGPGEMDWLVPAPGHYIVTLTNAQGDVTTQTIEASDTKLHFDLGRIVPETDVSVDIQAGAL